MQRLAYLALLLGACGADDRPLTVAYVTETVLAPSCGAAQCHSTFSANYTDIFDTVEGARASIVNNQLLSFDSDQYDPATPTNAHLILTVTVGAIPAIGRMPWDSPLPEQDIELLERWIAAGAPGAQCNPVDDIACNNDRLMSCNDWNFGNVIEDCAALGKRCNARACK
jgi:hypothetical protein